MSEELVECIRTWILNNHHAFVWDIRWDDEGFFEVDVQTGIMRGSMALQITDDIRILSPNPLKERARLRGEDV